MEISKQILAKAGVTPRLRLATKLDGGGVKGTGAHKVILLPKEKLFKGTDRDGKEVDMIRYYFTENGEERCYEVPIKDKQGEPHYLIERFAELEPNSELILEYKRSGAKGYIEVTVANPGKADITNPFNNAIAPEEPVEDDMDLEEPPF